MVRPLCLCVLIALAPEAQAALPIPAVPLSNLIEHKDTSRANTFQATEAQLHQEVPEYIGFEVWGGKLYLALDTTDPGRRQQILQRVVQLQADFLSVLQFHAGAVVFLLPPASLSSPPEIRPVLAGIRGLIFDQDQASSRIARTIIGLQDESQRPAAQKVLREAGIAEDRYLIVSGTKHGLQPRDLEPRLTGEYNARLVLPPGIQPGETVHSSIIFRNTGKQAVTLDFGTCPPPVEIRNARTRQLVLGIPWMVTCAGVGQMVTLVPGGETVLKAWTWKAELPDGRPIPPGRYVMRAAAAGVSLQVNGKYGPSGVVIPPSTEFTIGK